MSLTRLLFILLILGLITGAITFKGFVLGSGALLLSQILLPIIAILFAVVLIKSLSSSSKQNFPYEEPKVNIKPPRDYIDTQEDSLDK
ncbi:MAG: hypothetical protein P4L22_05750 [Candidatus Babeliales bacterium]|nr:hypothetical protein [Candidatus Babeliales bacterium]